MGHPCIWLCTCLWICMYVYTYLYIIMHKKFFTEFLFPVFIACAFYYVFNYTLNISFIFNVLQLKYYKSCFNYNIYNQKSHLKSLYRAICSDSVSPRRGETSSNLVSISISTMIISSRTRFRFSISIIIISVFSISSMIYAIKLYYYSLFYELIKFLNFFIDLYTNNSIL